MKINPTPLLFLSLFSCEQPNSDQRSKPFPIVSQSEREHEIEKAEAKVLGVLGETGDATWVNWPTDRRDLAGADKPCIRVSEQSREAAIRLLSQNSLVAIDRTKYEQLTGRMLSESGGTPYLLRGFSTNNSSARVTVAGNNVTVHSEALGGLFDIRRHPCVAMLSNAPSTVYTVVGYDL